MPDLQTPVDRTPRDVLARYYQAMLDKSADDLADLYAVDALHEFPFAAPGFPPCFEGREAVRAGYRAAWGASPVEVAEIKEIAAYETADPSVIIAEQIVVGTLPAGRGTLTVPGLLILHVSGGLIRRVRDYIDGSAASGARG
ncbi:nuclear transport factor 2 family protein [Streptomyces sp. TS71-3]|uniref:nuclear transport factor 2 family protein n=1 Tax=Streptomyces sp. TS71-3 TaxID=2733862 RepID=UPI002016EDCC|nr:nuclear transport factor 2 family protein [Streptomyces sp. TS71-3]